MPDHAPDRAASRLLQAVTVRSAVAAGDYPSGQGGRLAEMLEHLARRAAYPARPAPGAAGPGTVPAGEPVTDSVADRALAAFLSRILSRRGPDIHDYLSGALGYSPERATGLRHFCGRRLLVLQLVPRWTTGGVRDLYVCERCGPACTVPSGGRPPGRIEIDASRVRVEFAEPLTSDGWYTACRQPIGGHPEEPGAPRPLRAGATGLSVELPARTTRGLRRFAIALVADGECVVVQLPTQEQ
ncbi:hypothetical protein [Streptomyces sp. NPDC051569]|uniref:hypothetical protein n=1 Tax=Streptomyces sp. NPDC051569 TaxID=3365661 RepID=UPI0037B04FB3